MADQWRLQVDSFALDTVPRGRWIYRTPREKSLVHGGEPTVLQGKTRPYLKGKAP